MWRRLVDARCLLEELGNLLAVEGAAVAELAGPDVLGDLANLGGGDVLELGGLDGGILVEQVHDDVVLALGEGAGGHVADQPLVAVVGLGGLDGEEDGVVGLGGPLSATAGAQESGAKDETLEEDSASEKTEGSSRTSGEGDSAGGGSGGADDEGGEGGVHSQGHDGQGGANLEVHAARNK